ncbi:glycoside hydrolase family 16 protein [Echinicola vietnamensis]|uniref:Beta-glucanase/beta-glucan synthetase n=1 Tax=Echinicola vietnamensis (strain DSM 17526 / LMG 23754 / KMM 6221) TaxID=926556 RepID=L0G6S0_ECHVK|nr:glycoside hydrolase family 16 protein [Echinicola vietnamensis]AGA80701.1 beta-glucanase/beta-glucan synthetase [Echinicola vietnamensis DSM 17526]
MTQHIFWTLLFLIHFDAVAPSSQNHVAFVEHFEDPDLVHFRYGSTGTEAGFKYAVGVNSPSEPGTKILSFKIDPEDVAGAGHGPEIISKDHTHFGTYSARLKVPKVKDVQPNIGAVVGYFTYHEDSLAGLSEIDFEWLPANPTVIYIGTWTGGQSGKLERIGRTINLAKGIIYETTYRKGHSGPREALTGLQSQPETIMAIPDFDASSSFYTYGFDWHKDRIQWWILHPDTGEKVILWDYRGSPLGIPQHRTYYRMNFWHTDQWAVETNPLSLEKPLKPFQMEVDWMFYEPLEGNTQ